MSRRTTAIIGGIGRTLVTLGCLTVTFAGFQLWGTGVAEGLAQDALADDFEQRQQAFAEFAARNGVDAADVGDAAPPAAPSSSPRSASDGSGSGDGAPPSPPDPPPAETAADVPAELLPAAGDALGVIRIPSIELDKVIINGTRRDDLRKGPGHYPSTPLPGQAGNAAIAGHRTTYGAPFGDLDQLEPGDLIEVETFQGTFFYEVLSQTGPDGETGYFIVEPHQVEILDDFGDNRLTLTACHPKYSARQRIVVQAQLVNDPAAPIALDVPDEPLDPAPPDDLAFEATGLEPGELPSGTVGAASGAATGSAIDEGNVVGLADDVLDESLGWHTEEVRPFAVWSALTAVAAGLAVILAARWRKWTTYGLVSPLVLTLLFFSFTHLDRMLPAF